MVCQAEIPRDNAANAAVASTNTSEGLILPLEKLLAINVTQRGLFYMRRFR